MFTTVEQRFDKHVVIPDLHGEYAMLENVLDRYIDDTAVGFVLLGDVVDRQGVINDPEKGVARTIETIRQLGARGVLLIANHEWVPLGAMLSKNPQEKANISEFWLGGGARGRYERNTLSAYGIVADNEHAPTRFKEELTSLGHLAVLTSASPYYETDTFIATHAGIDKDIPWAEQRELLSGIASDMSNGRFEMTPNQWFSMDYAVDASPLTSTQKTVVSGHAHYLSPKKGISSYYLSYSPERSLHDGKRVRLASQLNAPGSNNIFVWQDWNNEVVEIGR